MEERVTLIIKAANQGSPDQRLECDSQWSISTLKGHLAEAHPSHPNTQEQRLIYSGQLLADHHLLCNVLRRPSDDNAYTIHLVCSPPQPSQPLPPQTHTQPPLTRPAHPATSQEPGMSSPNPNSSPSPSSSSSPSGSSSPSSPSHTDGQVMGESTDGVRRRHPPTTTTTSPTLDAPGPPPTPTPTMLQVGGVLQPSADPIHQVAAMQQIYAHYMAYVQYMQMGGGVGGLPWPQQMIQIPPPPNPATTTTTTTAAAAAAATTTTTTTEPAEPPQPDPNLPADPQPQPQPQQQPIRMNAQGGEVEEDEEEEGAGRDWLDWVYVLSRMLVLLSIVYFYSTLSRFMVVVFIAVLLYLYQAGWFRPSRRVDPLAPQQPPQQPQQQQQDNIINNNHNDTHNTPPEENEEEEEEEEDEDDDDDDDDEEITGPTREQVAGGSGGREVPATVRPSLLSLSWTFLTTFFTSLIPEQPQGI